MLVNICILISSHSFKRKDFSRWPCLAEWLPSSQIQSLNLVWNGFLFFSNSVCDAYARIDRSRIASFRHKGAWTMFGFEREFALPSSSLLSAWFGWSCAEGRWCCEEHICHGTDRKSVALGGVAAAQPLAAFPSRHARVAFLLSVNDYLSDQEDPYVLSTDQAILDRLRD